MIQQTKAQLPALLQGLHDKLCTELGITRDMIPHPGIKGDSTESLWVQMLQNHLPARYQVNKAFVIDSQNRCSDQIDIVIHDRQYSPFVLNYNSGLFVPAESVYAVFEVKQEISLDEIKYAANKVASVRQLHRTSIPIQTASGPVEPKKPHHIVGGLLCLESAWSSPFGDPFEGAMRGLSYEGNLDLGCVARHGVFEVQRPEPGLPEITSYINKAPLAYFLLRLIARLQCMATVPCLDVMKYANWIND